MSEMGEVSESNQQMHSTEKPFKEVEPLDFRQEVAKRRTNGANTVIQSYNHLKMQLEVRYRENPVDLGPEDSAMNTLIKRVENANKRFVPENIPAVTPLKQAA